jgi:uncharacterized protein DUF6491
MKKIILLAAGLCALASTPAFANRTCLEIGQIYNWNVLDNKTLVVEDNFHNRFRMSLIGTCPTLNFKERVGFKSQGATQLSCLTPGDDVIVRNFGTGPQVCPIREVVPYTPEMEKADMDAAAAKKAGMTDAGGTH